MKSVQKNAPNKKVERSADMHEIEMLVDGLARELDDSASKMLTRSGAAP